MRASPRTVEREPDDLKWMLHRVGVSGNPELKSRGVKHRGYVIDERNDVFDPLSDVRVVQIPADIAEDVDREINVVRDERLPCLVRNPVIAPVRVLCVLGSE